MNPEICANGVCYSPIGNKCLCESSDCSFEDSTKPIGPNGANVRPFTTDDEMKADLVMDRSLLAEVLEAVLAPLQLLDQVMFLSMEVERPTFRSRAFRCFLDRSLQDS